MSDRAEPNTADPAVADGLALYVWRKPAVRVSRWAERAGIPPGTATATAALLGALVFMLFWTAHYWPGLVTGFTFGLAAITAGQQARLNGSSIKPIQAAELLVPPLWWWAWEHGLTPYGRPLAPLLATIILWAIVGGYAGQRIVEWLAVRRFGVAIDRWKPFDSRFRLVAAGTNANLLILLAAMGLANPRLGLKLVAWWTLISLIVAAVRFSQMNEEKARGRPVSSWLGS